MGVAYGIHLGIILYMAILEVFKACYCCAIIPSTLRFMCCIYLVSGILSDEKLFFSGYKSVSATGLSSKVYPVQSSSDWRI